MTRARTRKLLLTLLIALLIPSLLIGIPLGVWKSLIKPRMEFREQKERELKYVDDIQPGYAILASPIDTPEQTRVRRIGLRDALESLSYGSFRAPVTTYAAVFEIDVGIGEPMVALFVEWLARSTWPKSSTEHQAWVEQQPGYQPHDRDPVPYYTPIPEHAVDGVKVAMPDGDAMHFALDPQHFGKEGVFRYVGTLSVEPVQYQRIISAGEVHIVLTRSGEPVSNTVKLLTLTADSGTKARTEPSEADTELERFTNSIGMKFKLIPAGEFVMGAPESDHYADGGERPQHRVRITKPFFLSVCEVTRKEYGELMGTNPVHLEANRPVENVSWDEAVEFCERLSAREGKVYRLPSEAEWEYACRAGTTAIWFFGNNADQLRYFAWCGEIESSQPVGTKKANPWGLFDMYGNVWEWCQDWSGDYSSDEAVDPTGPSEGTVRVLRGGSWNYADHYCRSSARYAREQKGVGFRVVLVPPDSPD